MRTLRATILSVLCVAFASYPGVALGQAPAPQVPDNAWNPTDTIGMPPQASREGTAESVDLSNGALTMFIPVLTLPQRAGTQPLVLGFTYDSNQLSLQQDMMASPVVYPLTGQFTVEDSYTYSISAAETGLYAGPLQFNVPELVGSLEYEGDAIVGGNEYPTPSGVEPVFCLTNMAFIDWSGTAHPFPAAIPNCTDEDIAYDTLPIGPVYKADSSDGLFYRLDTTNQANFTVTAPDGTVYNFPNPNIPCPTATSYACPLSQNVEQFLHQVPSSIVDRNGATTTIATSATGSNQNGVPVTTVIQQITDTLGRTVTLSSDTTDTMTIAYQDSQGNQQSATLSMENTFEPIPGVSGPDVGPTLADNSCFYTVPTNPDPPATQYGPLTIQITPTPPGGSGGPNGTGFTPYDLTFTGSGKHYHMLFDSFGHLMKIVYPSGGYHRYDYSGTGVNLDQGPVDCTWEETQVAHRYECSSSTGSCAQEDTTAYVTGNPLFPSAVATVTTPDGTVTQHTFGPDFAPGSLSSLETDTLVTSSSGAQTQETKYSFSPYNNGVNGYGENAVYPFPTTVTTKLYGGPSPISSYVNYSYDTVATQSTPENPTYEDPHTGNPTIIDEYGYDGTHLRNTVQSWWDQKNVLNALSSSTVTDPVGGNTTSVTYGRNNNGNITSITRSGTNAGPYTTTITPDAYGRPLSVTDPRNVTTTYAYNDAACPSSGTPPDSTTAVTNALNQTTTYSYDACMGLLASVKDANSEIVSAQYDGIGRPTLISYPDGGSRTLNYNGDAVPLTTTITQTAAPDPNEVSSQTLDGLGRVSKAISANGAETDTNYDSVGRVASVSNPYFPDDPQPTDGTTSYSYDAVNRMIQQTQPDGKSLFWCYNGLANASAPPCLANQSSRSSDSWTNSWDEDNNLWQRTSDALGRLTSVVEPDAAETDYQYDALDNLRCVDQWAGGTPGTPCTSSAYRQFSYDGLSRLTSAYNPETGTVGYSYDPNGNVTSKTDARGAVVTYCYDSLNRLASKGYSGQTCPMSAPDVAYSYDTSPVSGNSNTVGRLTAESTFANGAATTERQPYSYDAMGRLLAEQQCVLGNCSSSPNTLNYTYDQAGNVTTSTNGMTNPGVLLTSTYDGAGQLATLSSSWDDAQHPATLFSVSTANGPAYDAGGQLLAANLAIPSGGQQAAITLAKAYDVRLRPVSESAGGLQGTPAQAATGTLTVTGTEQSIPGTPTPATATIVLTAPTQQSQVKPLYVANATITIDGYTKSFPTPIATAIGVADSLAAALNVAGSPVTATVVSGGTASTASVQVVTNATGAAQNGPISLTLVDGVTAAPASLTGGSDYGIASQATGTIALSASTQQSQLKPLYVANARIVLPDGYAVSFPTPIATAIGVADSIAAALNAAASPVTAAVNSGGTSSAASVTLTTKATGADQDGTIALTLVDGVTAAPASLTGGNGTTYDTGTVTVEINGTSVSASYSQSSTPQTLAQALVSAIDAGSLPVTATAGTGGAIALTATTAGAAGNSITASLAGTSSEPGDFSSSSFSGGSATLTGGVNSTSNPGVIYNYTIPAPTPTTGYAPNGNLLSYNDLVTGNWTMSYDNLNRVTNASVSSGPWATLQMGWGYDAFGNRTSQSLTGNPSAPAPQSQSWVYPANNQSSTSSYDSAGNVLNDGTNQYAYDTEGRLCAVYSGATGDTTGYLYDAEGKRVAKGTIQAQLPLTAAACNLASNGFAATESYVLDDSGEQVSEMNGSGNFLRSHVYANGGLLATYTNAATDFALNDWLGTKHVVADETGTAVGSCTSLPFGDELSCSGSASTSGHHYTGKVHDLESGNDFFPARYYGSSMGRFISPDPSGLTYANPYNPQSLNLYSYVLNNPLINIDPTGKDCVYLSDDATSLEEVDADSDTSVSDCNATGGTHVEGSLTGYGSTDPDGTINEFYSNAYGTQNGSQNSMPNPSTWSGFGSYLGAFLNGSGPTNVLYGPGNTATQQMQSTQNVQKLTNQYVQAGCPGTPGSPAPIQQAHLAAYRDSAMNSPANPTQIEVGGYSGGIYTVNGTTTFTINNPSSMSSLDAESAANGSHYTDNPMGPTGPGHTVNQTFQWSEAGLCGH